MRHAFERPAATPKPPARVARKRAVSRDRSDDVLDLQRAAGNQAVARVLARNPRDKRTRVTLKGLASFPVESFQLGREPTEWLATKELDDSSSDLQRAFLDGKPIPIAEVAFTHSAGRTIHRLGDALITGYSVSSGGGEALEQLQVTGKTSSMS
jgi:hypothetical protein